MNDRVDGRQRLTQIQLLEPLILMSASALSCEMGTDGNDVLVAAEYGQTLRGHGGDDILLGEGGHNSLFGGDGEDLIVLFGWNNAVNGGQGHDTVVYADGNRDDFMITRVDSRGIVIGNCQRQDWIRDVEEIRFNDGTFTVAELLGEEPESDPEYRTIDGTGNNFLDAELGSTDEPLLRLATMEYGDGKSTPASDGRPSAREVSNVVSEQITTEANDRALTDMVWLWGQFIDHDISLSEGVDPAEPFNIAVPAGDPDFDPFATGVVEIGLNRTVYDLSSEPRQQVNQITAYIDGGMIYGSDEVRAEALRSFEGGRLQLTDQGLLIFNEAGLPNAGGSGAELFLAGDVRANENAALTSMHTLWAREHNRIAEQLAVDDPSLTDEQLYQQAREYVIGEIQSITYNQFLPALLGAGALSEFTGYDVHVDPTIANEFSTAAYRFGHTMLTSELQRLNNDGTSVTSGSLPLRDAFFSPQQVLNEGVDSLLIGAAHQAANEVDTQVVDDVRNFLFGPPGAGGFDLASLNIQRGRDHGLADYNQVRSDIGLPPVSSFAEITSDVELQNRLRDLYGSVDQIDLWVGGLAEDHVAGSSLGQTFQAIITDQFTRLRDGDRFWYQNIFEGQKLTEIESVTLSDVIERNTTADQLQENVFFLPPGSGLT